MYYLNLDFIYYLIYLFFRGIWDFITFPFGRTPIKGDTNINLLDLINYFTSNDYGVAGNGLGVFSDGYSLFSPPNGFESWGNTFGEAVSNWLTNFFNNPYCLECPSFADMIFGGINALFWALIFLLFIFWLFLKDKENRLKEIEYEKYERVFDQDEEGGGVKSQKWEEILALVNSNNINDWRIAVINADNLLDDVLLEQGYSGVGLGEKLKTADFSTLQNAWDAHKIRNLIAHDSNYQISQREAKKAIQNFSLVFNEFYYL